MRLSCGRSLFSGRQLAELESKQATGLDESCFNWAGRLRTDAPPRHTPPCGLASSPLPGTPCKSSAPPGLDGGWGGGGEASK